jgi:RHS repeat-associated protein
VWQDVAGTVTQQAAYAAFGDGLFAPGGGSCCSLQAGMFDSAWQDSANNTYHTLNREYSPTQGRWLTPDPAGLAVMDITNPQSWNRYAYVNNNPVSATDPLGLERLCGGGGDSGMGGDDGSGDGTDDPTQPPSQYGGGVGPSGDPFPSGTCGDFTFQLPVIPIFGGGGGRRGGGGSPSGGTQAPLPGSETAGLPQLLTQPLSLGDLLGLTPGCDFGVCNPIGNGFEPAGVETWPLPTLTSICAAVPGCVQIATGILIGITLVLQKGDAQPLDPNKWIMCYSPVKISTNNETICQYSCSDGKNRHAVFYHPNAVCPDPYPFPIDVGWLGPRERELIEQKDDGWAYGDEADAAIRVDEGLLDRAE